MTSFRVVRYPSLGAVLVATTLAVTACGSSSPNGSSAGGGSSSSGINVAQAKKDLDARIDAPATIELPKVGRPIPPGKTIDYITCQVAVCTEVGDGVRQAAKSLGWQVRVVASNSTPSGYQQVWQQIAQNPGDGVINASPILPYSAITSEMDAANVPVVSSTSPSPVGGHLIAVVASSAGVQLEGETEANWVIQDAGAPVKSVYVYDPSIPALASAVPGYQQAMKKNCPACSVAVLKVSVFQIGPVLAQQVVSYLQSNPDVKYVAFGLGDLATGVPAAIRAAGLENQAKLTTRAATPTNLQDVKSGGMAAVFTSELYESGWRAVDKLARALAGAPIGDQYPLGITREITQANLPSSLSVPYSLPAYEDSFRQAWGVS